MHISVEEKGAKTMMPTTFDESENLDRSAKGKGIKRGLSMRTHKSLDTIHSEKGNMIAEGSEPPLSNSNEIVAHDQNSNVATPSPSAIQSAPPLTEFHLFGQLPKEIRLIIWKRSFLDQRRHIATEVSAAGIFTGYKDAFSTPSISALFVNWEARKEAEIHYKCSEKLLHFNKDQDSLFVHLTCTPTEMRIASDKYKSLRSLKVKHLILDEFDWDSYMLPLNEAFFRVLVGMTELETISVVASRRLYFNTDQHLSAEFVSIKNDAHQTIYQISFRRFQKEFSSEWKIPTLIYLDATIRWRDGYCFRTAEDAETNTLQRDVKGIRGYF